MNTKIIALSVYITMCLAMFAFYLFAGWRGFCTALASAILYGTIALIMKNERDRIAEDLSRYKAEVHNLRLYAQQCQEHLYLANSALTPYGYSVSIPEMLPTCLPSVFDQRKK